MEAMKQWEESQETEELNVALRGRLPSQQRNTNTSDATSGDFVFSSECSSEAESLEEEKAEEIKDSPRNGASISDKNGGTESSYGVSGSDGVSGSNSRHADSITSNKSYGGQVLEVKVENLSIQKSAVINHQDVGDMKGEELNGFRSSPSKQLLEQNGHYTSLNLRERGEEKVSELYLERVYEKPAAHDFYCPNCNACITKVLIRGEEWENRPPTAPPPAPADPIRCTSCFSFLIPAGSWFFPKLVPKDEENNTEQGTNVENRVEVGVSVLSHDLGGTLQYQNIQTTSVSNGQAPNESVGDGTVQYQISQTASVSNGRAPIESVGDGTVQYQNSQAASVSSGRVTNESVGASAADITKPTIPAQFVGLEFPFPSDSMNEPLYDKKPTIPAQSVGVSEVASLVPGKPVEAIVGITAEAIPSVNNFKSSAGVDLPVTSQDSNLNNQQPPMPSQSVGVSVTVTSKPSASEIDVVAISQDAPLFKQVAVPGESRLNGAVGETDAGPAETEFPVSTTVVIREAEPTIIPQPGDTKTIEILKSVVYGGLTEAITSLGIVTSAASADAATLNILALALANLLGGLFIIGHHLWELKYDQSRVPASQTDEQVDRYQQVLGKRENFFLHASAAISSFIVFGLVPPLVYGFSFRQSNNTDLKIAAVAVASLLCIIILASGKAYIQKPPKYIKTVLYYIGFGIGVAGLSYLAGDLIDKLLEKLGWFSSNVSGTLPLPQIGIVKPALASY